MSGTVVRESRTRTSQSSGDGCLEISCGGAAAWLSMLRPRETSNQYRGASSKPKGTIFGEPLSVDLRPLARSGRRGGSLRRTGRCEVKSASSALTFCFRSVVSGFNGWVGGLMTAFLAVARLIHRRALGAGSVVKVLIGNARAPAPHGSSLVCDRHMSLHFFVVPPCICDSALRLSSIAYFHGLSELPSLKTLADNYGSLGFADESLKSSIEIGAGLADVTHPPRYGSPCGRLYDQDGLAVRHAFVACRLARSASQLEYCRRLRVPLWTSVQMLHSLCRQPCSKRILSLSLAEGGPRLWQHFARVVSSGDRADGFPLRQRSRHWHMRSHGEQLGF